MKSLDETVRNIDRNVTKANARLRDIYQLFSHLVKKYQDDYYALTPDGYRKVLEE